MNLGYLTKNISLNATIKDVDGKKGTISGYFAVFNNEDSDGDTIMPGAFVKTIQERGPASSQPRIKMLRNHLIWEPVGKLTELEEDRKGLRYVGQAGTHAIGIDTVKMIESDLITEHSFGFETVRKQVVNPDADWRDRKQILYELRMWEGSLLTAWGANERTGGATMKSMGKDAYMAMLTKRSKALDKFCRNSDATDETIELLLIECKQLNQIILDLSNTSTLPGKTKTSTVPVPVIKSMDNFINSLKNS